LVTDFSGKKAVVTFPKFYIFKKKILEDENITLYLNVENNVCIEAEE
jgi:hypothetical protein